MTPANTVPAPPPWWRIGLIPPLLAMLPLALLLAAVLAGLAVHRAAERGATQERVGAGMARALEAALEADARLLALLAAVAGAGEDAAFRAAAQALLARMPDWYTLALEDPAARRVDLRRPAEASPSPRPIAPPWPAPCKAAGRASARRRMAG